MKIRTINKSLTLIVVFGIVLAYLIIFEIVKARTRNSIEINNEILTQIESENVYANRDLNQINWVDQNSSSNSTKRRYVFFDLGANNGDSILMFLKLKDKGIISLLAQALNRILFKL